jgi:hypothetical protein
MSNKLLLRSFAGGEITPELAGRLDLVKYQTGLSLARNFVTLPHGPAARRPGFEFINEARLSTSAVRLMPFAFSASQTAVLEFGDLYIRFHIGGGTLIEATVAISSIAGSTVNTTGVHGYTTGDWVYIGSRYHKVTVVDTDTFTTTDLWGAATTAVGTTSARVYTLTSTYAAADLFDLHFTQSADVITITHPNYPAKELKRLGATNWTLTDVSFAPTLSPPSKPTVVDTFVSGSTQPQEYCITAVGSDGVTESLASASTSVNNNLTVGGAFNTITWTPVSSVSRYYIYKRRGGGFGYMGQAPLLVGKTISSITRAVLVATLTTATDHNLATNDVITVTGAMPAAYNGTFAITVTGATTFEYTMLADPGASAAPVGSYCAIKPVVDENVLPDTTQSPPEDIIDLNTGAGDYPTATTYHEQRRWFAGSTNKPQVVWATRTGTESNLNSSLPSREADGLEVRVASMQNNQIRHLVPLSDLIAFTAGGEFRMFADGAPAITPSSISIKPQGYTGASNVQPVVSSGSILYVQAQGSRIRELAYGGESANYSYKTIDVSIMAPHRFNGYTVSQLAYARAPEPTLWAVRNDGVLLGMTYIPEQQVYGWHAHDTLGTFESICVVAEGNEDVLYAVVKRTVNSRDVRYIERLRTRIFTDLEDAFFVDSGLTYDGAPITSLGGLYHLEGRTVDILADGSVEPTQVVTGGTITLATAASKVHVGLNIVADIRTLPLAIEGMQASGQGTIKNVNKVHLRVSQSSLVKAGPDFTRLREYPARSISDPYGSPPALRDGELSLAIDPSWSTDAAICVRQDSPVPLTVLSMTLEVQGGG